MAGNSNADIPSALYNINSELSRLTVDKLKNVIRKLNDHCNQNLKTTGLKQELLQRCRDTIAALSRSGDTTRFWSARVIVSSQLMANSSPQSSHSQQITSTGVRPPAYDPYGSNGYRAGMTAGSSSGYGATVQPARPTYTGPAYGSGYPSYSGAQGSSSIGASRGALPPPRFGPNGAGPSSGSSSGPYANNGGAVGYAPPKYDEIPLRFRPNPFYRVDKSLSGVCPLPRAGEGDRKSVRTQFALTEAQRNLLTAAKASPGNKQYQVRLYCTSEMYFNQARPASGQLPAPMEFPSTCEIRLNNMVVPASTKGIKKQVGTASPVNLGRTSALNLSSGVVNQLDMIYTNSDKVSKKYFMVVYLVEVTSIKTLVDRVKDGKTKTPDQVIQSIIKINEDPDLEASSFSVSLKDPLTMGRMKIPIRSEACTHISCFDAEIWFTINEQTPTWTCPICSKALRVEDLIVDGYLQNALKVCSSEVEGIVVNPDGTWRSDDDRHGTAPPKSDAPSRAQSTTRGDSMKPDPAALSGALSNGNGTVDKGKSKLSEEAVLLDSDDDEDDQPLAKRQRLNGVKPSHAISLGSSPIGSPRTGNAPSKRMDTIDLTLSDSDDDEVRPAAPPVTRPPPPPSSHSFPGLPPKPVPPRPWGTYESTAATNASSTTAYGISPPSAPGSLPPRSASAGGGFAAASSFSAANPPAPATGADHDDVYGRGLYSFGSANATNGSVEPTSSTSWDAGKSSTSGFQRFSDQYRDADLDQYRDADAEYRRQDDH